MSNIVFWLASMVAVLCLSDAIVMVRQFLKTGWTTPWPDWSIFVPGGVTFCEFTGRREGE